MSVYTNLLFIVTTRYLYGKEIGKAFAEMRANRFVNLFLRFIV